MNEKNDISSTLLIACLLFFSTLLFACGTAKKVNTDYIYFQSGPESDTVTAQKKETIIQPGDLLSIQVFSKTLNQEQVSIFNLFNSGNGPMQGYQVSVSGTIEMPVIGTVEVGSLTKEQLQVLLVQKLLDYVKNPSVIVRFIQFSVNVLGEVRTPGIQRFNTDRVTIIDAISAAGDLTDYGRREDITVVREEGEKKIYHTVDLRSKTIFQSPVYVLQPNDIVYVRPNKNKLKSLSADPEGQRRTGLIITIIGVVLSVSSFVITNLR